MQKIPEYAPGQEFNEEEATTGEPIAPNMMSIAQPLIAVFDEPPMRKIFSRAWNLREEGINEIEEIIVSGRRKDQSELFVAGIAVVKQTISDKILGVVQRAI